MSSVSHLTDNRRAGNMKTHIAAGKKNFMSALAIPLEPREIYGKDAGDTGFEFTE
jgi:hypothetical protein